jgi:hypothetical protein
VRHFDYADDIQRHLRLADLVFETIALVLHNGSSMAGQNPGASRRVTTNLLTQIAQDIKAVGLLASSGFPYQAVAVCVSTFEHSMMLVSIDKNDARAEKWLQHSAKGHNIETVKELVRRALKNLDRDHAGIADRLGDLYEGMHQPLCAFKHGNPMVQQHIHSAAANSSPLSIFTVGNRRAVIAAFWALETAIRSGWLALLSFVTHHVQVSADLSDIMKGIDRSSNEPREIRAKKEREPN